MFGGKKSESESGSGSEHKPNSEHEIAMKNAIDKMTDKSTDSEFEYKCYRVNKNSLAASIVSAIDSQIATPVKEIPQAQVESHKDMVQVRATLESDIYNNGGNSKEGMEITEDFTQFIDDQSKQNLEMSKMPTSIMKPMPTMNIPKSTLYNDGVPPLPKIDLTRNTNFSAQHDVLPILGEITGRKPEPPSQLIPNEKAGSSPHNNSDNDIELPIHQNYNKNSDSSDNIERPMHPNKDANNPSDAVFDSIDDEYKTYKTNIPYSTNYVQYQRDGQQQQEEDKISAKVNAFRRDISDQRVIDPWNKEAVKFYTKYQERSVGAPPAKDSFQNELQYGDYNYVAPLNNGMINKSYTSLLPANWYPIPPHPPICVTNKSCTVCPVRINDRQGNDYMNYADWDEFDAARRFTGDMGINTEYIKNVLNVAHPH
ncbi:MAG: 7tm chemosensory receptor/ankyrin repeat domain-containing protein [Gaeavirus sp.]|uniref:7tm chemosensory receptor/ankyrin repeat domain-containing protein n=1 Tax=Gaeavirus sp. TaxID=2487767 RepID=A0A3G4ZZ17_9VIRU|nr:MAG: 7tm chemosensory receptor/ankyrin repeat domain-containing protein [Gaeavirus sp.]